MQEGSNLSRPKLCKALCYIVENEHTRNGQRKYDSREVNPFMSRGRPLQDLKTPVMAKKIRTRLSFIPKVKRV